MIDMYQYLSIVHESPGVQRFAFDVDPIKFLSISADEGVLHGDKKNGDTHIGICIFLSL